MNATKEVLERLRDLAHKGQFVSFTYRTKQDGELARYTLNYGVNYLKQIEDSLLAITLLLPTLTGWQKFAAIELEESFKNTIEAFARGEYNPAYTKPEAYFQICNGLKYCFSTGVINASGLLRSKITIEPPVRKLNSPVGPIAAAKRELRLNLPVGTWREFCITPEHLETARLQGVTIDLE